MCPNRNYDSTPSPIDKKLLVRYFSYVLNILIRQVYIVYTIPFARMSPSQKFCFSLFKGLNYKIIIKLA